MQEWTVPLFRSVRKKTTTHGTGFANKNFRYDTIMTSVLTWHLAPGTVDIDSPTSQGGKGGATDLGDGQAYL